MFFFLSFSFYLIRCSMFVRSLFFHLTVLDLFLHSEVVLVNHFQIAMQYNNRKKTNNYFELWSRKWDLSFQRFSLLMSSDLTSSLINFLNIIIDNAHYYNWWRIRCILPKSIFEIHFSSYLNKVLHTISFQFYLNFDPTAVVRQRGKQ